MSYEWHIGMEVECIRDGYSPIQPGPFAQAGQKYTIAEIIDCGDGDTNLQFTTLRFIGNDGWYAGFVSANFRPVQKRKTDISIFERLLNPSEEDTFRELEAEVFDYENCAVPFR